MRKRTRAINAMCAINMPNWIQCSATPLADFSARGRLQGYAVIRPLCVRLAGQTAVLYNVLSLSKSSPHHQYPDASGFGYLHERLPLWIRKAVLGNVSTLSPKPTSISSVLRRVNNLTLISSYRVHSSFSIRQSTHPCLAHASPFQQNRWFNV